MGDDYLPGGTVVFVPGEYNTFAHQLSLSLFSRVVRVGLGDISVYFHESLPFPSIPRNYSRIYTHDVSTMTMNVGNTITP